MLFLALAAFLNAQQANASVLMARAKSAYAEADYANAAATLDEIVARADLLERDRKEALLMLGFSHVALGHEEAARRRFRDLVRMDNGYVLPPGTSPKLRAMFEEARLEVRNAPKLEALAPILSPAAAGDKVRLRFKGSNVREGHVPVLIWRFVGAGAFNERPLATQSGELTTQVTVDSPKRLELEYYAEVRDRNNQVLGSSGTTQKPYRYQLPNYQPLAGPTPFYKKWWFWTAIGAVAAGSAATATYLVLRPQPTTGSIDLSLGVAR